MMCYFNSIEMSDLLLLLAFLMTALALLDIDVEDHGMQSGFNCPISALYGSLIAVLKDKTRRRFDFNISYISFLIYFRLLSII